MKSCSLVRRFLLVVEDLLTVASVVVEFDALLDVTDEFEAPFDVDADDALPVLPVSMLAVDTLVTLCFFFGGPLDDLEVDPSAEPVVCISCRIARLVLSVTEFWILLNSNFYLKPLYAWKANADKYV